MAFLLRAALVALVYAALIRQWHPPAWAAWTIVGLVGLMAFESGAWNVTTVRRGSPRQSAKAQEDANILAAIERGMRTKPRL